MTEYEQYESSRREKANKHIEEVTMAYDEAVRQAESGYTVAARETARSFRGVFDANAVNEAVTLRQAREAIANANLANSGRNSTVQTVATATRFRADADARAQRQKAVDAVMKELDAVREQHRSTLEENIAKIHQAAEDDIAAYEQLYWEREARKAEAAAAQAARAEAAAAVTSQTLDIQGLNYDVTGLVKELQKEATAKVDTASTTSTILLPSQVEYLRAKAGDFRFDDLPIEALELQKQRTAAKKAQEIGTLPSPMAYANKIGQGLEEEAFAVKSSTDAMALGDMAVQDWQLLTDDIAKTYSDGEWKSDEIMNTHLEKIRTVQQALTSLISYYEQTGGSDATLESLYAFQAQTETVYAQLQRIQTDFGQYSTNKDYQKAMYKEQQAQENVEVCEKNLQGMENDLERVDQLTEEFNMLFNSPNGDSPELVAKREERLNLLRHYVAKYGIPIDDVLLESDIPNAVAERLASMTANYRQYVAGAKYVQKGAQLTKAAQNAADFAQKSQYDSTYAAEDGVYAYINGEASRSNKSECEKKAYDHMTDEEIAVYNYHYATGGKEVAQEYLYALEEELQYRSGEEAFSYYEDKWLSELVFGAKVGLEEFASGLKNLFNTEDEYIPMTSAQVTSQLIREDLEEDAGALAVFAYDLIKTTANMVPSVLTSVAVGTVSKTAGVAIGAALMGASASGNAYAQAINKGFDKHQARVYSACVGASELLMQVALGGISQLGGSISRQAIGAINSIDNALARVALKVGTNMVAEGTEEAIQEMMTPLFEKIAVGVQRSDVGQVDWENVAYSFLLGAFSGGLFGGADTGSEEVMLSKAGDAVIESGGTTALIEFANMFSADSEVRSIASQLDSDASPYQVGELVRAIADQGKTTETGTVGGPEGGHTAVDTDADFSAAFADGNALPQTDATGANVDVDFAQYFSTDIHTDVTADTDTDTDRNVDVNADTNTDRNAATNTDAERAGRASLSGEEVASGADAMMSSEAQAVAEYTATPSDAVKVDASASETDATSVVKIGDQDLTKAESDKMVAEFSDGVDRKGPRIIAVRQNTAAGEPLSDAELLRVFQAGVDGENYTPGETDLKKTNTFDKKALDTDAEGEYNISEETNISSSKKPGSSSQRPYRIFFEAGVGKGFTRSAHRRHANKEFYNRLESDPQFRKEMDELLGYDVKAYMASGKYALKNPSPDWEWHHPPDNKDIMELVTKQDHRDPKYQKIMHPNRRGGYAIYYSDKAKEKEKKRHEK